MIVSGLLNHVPLATLQSLSPYWKGRTLKEEDHCHDKAWKMQKPGKALRRTNLDPINSSTTESEMTRLWAYVRQYTLAQPRQKIRRSFPFSPSLVGICEIWVILRTAIEWCDLQQWDLCTHLIAVLTMTRSSLVPFLLLPWFLLLHCRLGVMIHFDYPFLRWIGPKNESIQNLIANIHSIYY